MIKTMLKLSVVGAVGLALAFGWQDIKRFVKIKQVSASGKHPEKIPVGGRTVYPQNHVGRRAQTAPAISTRRDGAAPSLARPPSLASPSLASPVLASRRRRLPHHARGVLVAAQAEIARMPELPGAGPLREGHLCDQPGLDPVHARPRQHAVAGAR